MKSVKQDEEMVLNFLGCVLIVNGRECALSGVDGDRATFEHEDGVTHLPLRKALQRLQQEAA